MQDVRRNSSIEKKEYSPSQQLNHPQSLTKIAKPVGPPPPPPSQPPRAGRIAMLTASDSLNNHSPAISSLQIASKFHTALKVEDDIQPPPPPPRTASASLIADPMDRFTFISIEELPLPEVFSRSKKIYEFYTGRKNAPAIPPY